MLRWIRLNGLFMPWHLEIDRGLRRTEHRMAACGASFRPSADLVERELDDQPLASERCRACQSAYGRLAQA